MTAEAENTMTSPTKTSSIVTVNSQRSTLTRFAMGLHFTTEAACAIPDLCSQLLMVLVRRDGFTGSFSGQSEHDFFKHPAAVLVTFELVEAGAGGSKQHDISRNN